MTDDLVFASAAEQAHRVAAGAVTARELCEMHLNRIDAVDDTLGAYLAIDRDGARAQADAIDAARARGDDLGPLAGVPIAVKDMLVTEGLATTAGSRILDGWIPPYDGTAVARLRAAGAVILGKTNLDEFAMGSSNENSAFGPCCNPWDTTRVPGGSSGGSAAAVAAGLAGAALGTDTGGSIRQPAAFCGVVGLKPTYGRVSRYGVIAFASSLDQVGPMSRTVEDAALLLEVIAGHDPRDATSIDAPVPRYRDALIGDDAGARPLAGVTVGLPAEFFDAATATDRADVSTSAASALTASATTATNATNATTAANAIDPEVLAAVRAAAATLESLGATLADVSLPHSRYALPAYYLIAPAEASSNLARYDGVRYGHRADGDLLDMYEASRGAGFGPEVKRRIMLGTFALRAGYYDAYYAKAQKARALIKADFDRALDAVDVLLAPTTPTPAFPIGARSSDPMSMYLSDIFTLSCNLAGLPGICVPCGYSAAGLPIGVQILGRPLDEARLLRVASAYERDALARGVIGRRPPEVHRA